MNSGLRHDSGRALDFAVNIHNHNILIYRGKLLGLFNIVLHRNSTAESRLWLEREPDTDSRQDPSTDRLPLQRYVGT